MVGGHFAQGKHRKHEAVYFAGLKVCVPCKVLVNYDQPYTISYAKLDNYLTDFLDFLHVEYEIIPRTPRSKCYKLLVTAKLAKHIERQKAFAKVVRRYVVKHRKYQRQNGVAKLMEYDFAVQLSSWNTGFNRSWVDSQKMYKNELTLLKASWITDTLEFNDNKVFKIVSFNRERFSTIWTVTLCGRTNIMQNGQRQNWAHTLPPMAWNWSIATCEKWLMADIPIAHRKPSQVTEIVEQA